MALLSFIQGIFISLKFKGTYRKATFVNIPRKL